MKALQSQGFPFDRSKALPPSECHSEGYGELQEGRRAIDDLHLVGLPGGLTSRFSDHHLKSLAHFSHVLRSIERPLRALSICM